MDKKDLVRDNKKGRERTEKETIEMLDHLFLPGLYVIIESLRWLCFLTELCPGGTSKCSTSDSCLSDSMNLSYIIFQIFLRESFRFLFSALVFLVSFPWRFHFYVDQQIKKTHSGGFNRHNYEKLTLEVKTATMQPPQW
ncbi:Serine/threonine-protein kinase AGC1-5 [Linum perenne]